MQGDPERNWGEQDEVARDTKISRRSSHRAVMPYE